MPKNEFVCDCNIIHEDKVKDTIEKMPESTILNNVAEFFKIMGDTTRCKLISALLQNEMCVCDLANILSMTKSSISHQLSKMKAAGIVKCRKKVTMGAKIKDSKILGTPYIAVIGDKQEGQYIELEDTKTGGCGYGKAGPDRRCRHRSPWRYRIPEIHPRWQ